MLIGARQISQKFELYFLNLLMLVYKTGLRFDLKFTTANINFENLIDFFVALNTSLNNVLLFQKYDVKLPSLPKDGINVSIGDIS